MMKVDKNPSRSPDGFTSRQLKLLKTRNQTVKRLENLQRRKHNAPSDWARRVQGRVRDKLILRSKVSKKKPLGATNATKKVINGAEDPALVQSSEKQSNEAPIPQESGHTKRAQKSREDVKATHECASCISDFGPSEVISFPCGHIYCHECVTRMYELFTGSETSSPPQCCGKLMEGSNVMDVLGIQTWTKYKDRKTELGDPNTLYCSTSNCSRYILPSDIRRRVGVCKHCMASTCVDCGKAKHSGNCLDAITARGAEAFRAESAANDALMESLAKKEKMEALPNVYWYDRAHLWV